MSDVDVWQLYKLMFQSRRIEESIKQLWDQGKIPGEMHLGIGEEAIYAGVISQLIEGDAVALDHRGTGPMVMRGVNLEKLILECMGHLEGLGKGQGGHMHLFSKEHFMSSSGIVGSSGPAAAGFALAAQTKKNHHIAVAFFGEGALNQGMMMESLNLAAAWQLPVLFICKDNNWAITTHSKDVTGAIPLDRAKAFGINGVAIDGTDVLTVWTIVNEILPIMREKGGPYFIVAQCEHPQGHFLGDPLQRFIKDPIAEFGKATGPLIKAVLAIHGARIDKRIANLGKILSLIAQSGSPMKHFQDPFQKLQQALATNPTKRTEIETRVNQEVELLMQQIADKTNIALAGRATLMKTMKFGVAIERALAFAMEKDPNIIIMGEDVHTLRANLFTQFGKDRVRSTPISESGFLGAGVTAAMAGLHPVVEIMLVDFTGVCMDGILNHAAKVNFFSGGTWSVPLVIRASCGGGYGDGGQHEQSLWGWFAHIPGISVAVPSTPADAGGLMLAALKADHPVMYMDHKLLNEAWLDYMGYGGRKNVTFDVPNDGIQGPVPDVWEPLPIGQAKVCQEGQDITLISVGVGVHRCLTAAEVLKKQNISAEVIDLRWVSPLDKKRIQESVAKTGVLIVVDEDYEVCGLSGEISAICLEANLKFKFKRVCTQTTIPFARVAKDATLPNVKRILEAVAHLVKK